MNPIKAICDMKGITQKELAKESKICEVRLSRLSRYKADIFFCKITVNEWKQLNGVEK